MGCISEKQKESHIDFTGNGGENNRDPTSIYHHQESSEVKAQAPMSFKDLKKKLIAQSSTPETTIQDHINQTTSYIIQNNRKATLSEEEQSRLNLQLQKNKATKYQKTNLSKITQVDSLAQNQSCYASASAFQSTTIAAPKTNLIQGNSKMQLVSHKAKG